MTDSIFTDQNGVTTDTLPDQPTAPQPGADDNLLKGILNEQGVQKYQSVNDALKALQASQEHIKRIEQENSQLREAANKVKTTEEILNALKPKTEEKSDNSIGIESVVEKVLNQREQQNKDIENQKQVVSALTALYGAEKAQKAFYEKAEELGLSKEEINKLAAKSPKAVIKLFSEEKATPKPSVSTLPGIRTEAINEQPATKVKSGMALGSTSDLLESWRQAGEKVKQANQG